MWSRMTDTSDLYDAAERRHGIHAGQIETSVMRHLHPDLVAMDQADNFQPLSLRIEQESTLLSPEGAVSFGWAAQDLHPSGACGDASKATAELGAVTVERAAQRLIVLIEEISRYPLARIATHTAFDQP
jgi:creatinine amidohydrolase